MQLLPNTYSKNNSGGFWPLCGHEVDEVEEERGRVEKVKEVEEAKETENLEVMEKVGIHIQNITWRKHA